MSNQAQKKQLSLNLQRFVGGAVADGAQVQGRGLPCTVVAVDCAIVTVTFDVVSDVFTLPQVKCPIAESIYVLLPIQVGDRGYVTSASARLGGVSGLGEGLAPLALTSNLGGLVFVPVGNVAWTTPDANAVIVQGPNGVIARTMDGNATVTINEDEISLDYKGKTVVINDSGITLTAGQNTVDGNLTVNGNTTMNGNFLLFGDFGMAGENFNVSTSGVCAFIANVAITGTFTVNGKDFTSHEHLPGAYHIGGSPVTGNSGTLV